MQEERLANGIARGRFETNALGALLKIEDYVRKGRGIGAMLLDERVYFSAC